MFESVKLLLSFSTIFSPWIVRVLFAAVYRIMRFIHSFISCSVNQWMDWISESLGHDRDSLIFNYSLDLTVITEICTLDLNLSVMLIVHSSLIQWIGERTGSVNLNFVTEICSFPTQWIRSVILSVMTEILFMFSDSVNSKFLGVTQNCSVNQLKWVD